MGVGLGKGHRGGRASPKAVDDDWGMVPGGLA